MSVTSFYKLTPFDNYFSTSCEFLIPETAAKHSLHTLHSFESLFNFLRVPYS